MKAESRRAFTLIELLLPASAKAGKDAEGYNSWTHVSSWLTCQRFRIGQPKAVC